jgi:hypothetical protein
LPGISTEQLRSRLNRMVADGLLTRQRYREVPPRVDYELTERSRDLMPVLGALARWGYEWTWGPPREGEEVNIGAILRLAPGLLSPARSLEGVVECVVLGTADRAERVYRLSVAGGRAQIAEGSDDGEADARVAGHVHGWVQALGPEGDLAELDFGGDRHLAETLLGGFSGAGPRARTVAAA